MRPNYVLQRTPGTFYVLTHHRGPAPLNTALGCMRRVAFTLLIASVIGLAPVPVRAGSPQLPPCPAGVILFEVTPVTPRKPASLRPTCIAPPATARAATQAARAWLPSVERDRSVRALRSTDAP